MSIQFKQFKATLLNSESFSEDKLKNYPIITNVIQNFIKASTTIEMLIEKFNEYSSKVDDTPGSYPFDAMNSCDGDESVCELFVIGLLDHTEWFTLYLKSIKGFTEAEDFLFIINEMISVMWKYPFKYSEQMEKFISNEFVGSYFSLHTATYVDESWYADDEINHDKLDDFMVKKINMFRKCHPQPSYHHTFKNWCTYSLEVMKVRNMMGYSKTKCYLEAFSFGLFDDMC